MKRLIACMLTGLLAAAPALGQACEPTAQTHAVQITGQPMQGAPVIGFPEISGERNFYQTLPNRWVFALMRVELGWSVRLYDREPVGEATDLTALTPPLHSVPNPRDILGWHFRNKDNTAPNAGEVNAPQEMRAFLISPGLAGTAGLRTSDGEQMPGPEDGIGWLKIVEYGLANPVPGTRARMNYLKFDACLSWPRADDETQALLDQASLDYADEDREIFARCGLDLQRYELSARHLPRMLGGDIDGDGALDQVAQVRRVQDDRRGLAICRAGTWLDLAGFGEGPIDDLRDGYAGQVEAWQWLTPDTDLPRHLTGHPLPLADGDCLILERIEKEAAAVFWNDGELQAHRFYHHVEP